MKHGYDRWCGRRPAARIASAEAGMIAVGEGVRVSPGVLCDPVNRARRALCLDAVTVERLQA